MAAPQGWGGCGCRTGKEGMGAVGWVRGRAVSVRSVCACVSVYMIVCARWGQARVCMRGERSVRVGGSGAMG